MLSALVETDFKGIFLYIFLWSIRALRIEEYPCMVLLLKWWMFKYKMINTYSCNWAFCSDTWKKTIKSVWRYDAFYDSSLRIDIKGSICGGEHKLVPSTYFWPSFYNLSRVLRLDFPFLGKCYREGNCTCYFVWRGFSVTREVKVLLLRATSYLLRYRIPFIFEEKTNTAGLVYLNSVTI